MIEIKFRAWDIDKKQMERDIFYVQNDGTVYKHERHPDNDLESDDSLVVMQYTGMHDKNGKEIYEGDIVEHYDGMGPVEMKKGSWCVSYDSNPKDRAFGKPDLLADVLANLNTDDQTVSIEIIGNIYENPELLQDNNK